MYKKIIAMLCAATLSVGLAACGQTSTGRNTDNTGDSAVQTAPVQDTLPSEETSTESPQPTRDPDLPVWIEGNLDENYPEWLGVWGYFGCKIRKAVGDDYELLGEISVKLLFPSMTTQRSSYPFVSQWDGTMVAVLESGYSENEDGSLSTYTLENTLVDSLADTFEVSKEYFCFNMSMSRNRMKYDDFDFIVETAEPVTINGFSMYKYTGTHTYTFYGEPQECSFVAYSVDTGQVEHAYFTIIVLDDSFDQSSCVVTNDMLEAYALKMAESVTITEYNMWEYEY